jgi:transcriptional regulator with XRE-family HTH domain
MKTKSFQSYLEKRLDKLEIAELEQQAKLEIKILRSIQEGISEAMEDYMRKNDIGFNELVRRLDASPTQVAKIQRGEANLTLSSLAHLFALMGKEPQDIFRNKKN